MGTALTEEHIKILEKYTQELVLCYDNDNAGVDATQRAIALLKGSQLQVKVLQLPRRRDDSGQLVKQDADDFIKNQGPEVFEGLLQGCANSVEYRLEEVRQGFDLSQDDQKAQYLQAAASLVAGLNSPVEREIYAGRAADAAGISREAMTQEVEQQRRQKGRQARRQEERRSLTPTQTLQPKQRELRYTNVRSALAEEGVLRVVLLDGSYFSQLEDLHESDFSAPLLGRAYGLLRRRWQEGKPVTLAALDGVFTPEEMDHLSSVVQQPQPMHTAQAALKDFKQTILAQHRRADIHSGQDLAQLRDLLKQKKSYGG